MSALKLTDAIARNATLPNCGRNDIILWDGALTGFGLRVRQTSKGIGKTWVVQYRDALGATRRYILGTVAELNAARARDVAADKLLKVRGGDFPHLERAQRAKAAELEQARAQETFGVISQTFLAQRQQTLHPRSFIETKRYIEKHWSPLHRVSIHDITQRQVVERLDQITAHSGKLAANHARARLSAFFVWAMRRGLTEKNPVANTEQHAETPRERVLSMEELVAIWNACRDDDHGRVVRLLMLTGQRCREIGGMVWAEIDTEHALWTLPKARAKNGEENHIPLVPAALALLPPRTGDKLFGRGNAGFNNYGQAKAALDARIKLSREGEGLTQLAPWTVHDLRRSFSTHLNKLGVKPHIVEVILNHVSHQSKVARVYNHAGYEDEVRQALLLWASHLAAAVNPDSPVVPLRRAG
jgi:integrase